MNLIILPLTIFLTFQPAGVNNLQQKTENVTHFLGSEIKNEAYPGIQYVVVDSGNVLFNYAGGKADILNNIEQKPATTMMAYSMTKTFTAVAILQLVEKGLLNLDDAVIKYIPEIPYGNRITVSQLITHTSGIPNPIPLKWVHLASEHSSYKEEDELGRVLSDNNKLSFEPGEKYAYSNLGYWLLGKIIENVSSTSYQKYMSDNIFKKLGLEKNELSFTITDSTTHAKGYLYKYSFFNLIKGFLIDDALIGEYEGSWLNFNHHYLNGPAFGGLIGSAQKIALFLQDQLRQNSRLINKQSKKLFYTRQKNNDNRFIEMTLGWHIGTNKGVKYYFKEGGGGGFKSEMRLYADQGIGTIIIVNRTSFNSRNYLNEIDLEFLQN